MTKLEKWLLYIAAVLLITAAAIPTIEPAASPGICIYEVSTNMLLGEVVIGWTPMPCTDLDIRVEADYNQLMHSNFRAACPVWSVQTWPEILLPVVSYSDDCGFQANGPPQRRAEIDHAIIR